MFKAPLGSTRPLSDYLTGAAIFITTLLIFWFSPVHQVTDSHYSMLLSEAVLKHRSFALDHFNIPRLQPNASTRDYYVMNGNIWQLELVGDRIYYYFPPGSSILSLPAVAVANALGISAANSDGTYNPRGESIIETSLAAILMAVTAVIFYLTARLLLSPFASALVALAGALGTQVWSTASRGLWSHTWETLLIALLVWLLLADATERRQLNPILLATLLSWLYFVRPTSSVVAIAVGIYVLITHRSLLLPFVLTGAGWLALFVAYSWIHFEKLLPSYYQANRLRTDLFPVAFAGNLLSPSRGIFIYVPVVLFVIYLIIRYWRQLPLKRLAWLSVSICALHLLFVSAFANLWGDWWAGASYGPRYSTELVPWLLLLAILGIKARSQARQRHSRAISGWREVCIGTLLLAFSVFINARGAISLDTWKWSQPSTDEQLRAQLWDWRHPQFLAGLQRPAPPVAFPVLELPTVIDLTRPEAGKYLWYGWSGEEQGLRWNDGKEATLIFGLSRPQDLSVEIRLAPFLAAPTVAEQRLTIQLNEQPLETLVLNDGAFRNFSLKLPKELLRPQNVLKFQLPDAISPSSVGAGPDDRILGIKVESIKFQAAD